jgi:hypothetical protein
MAARLAIVASLACALLAGCSSVPRYDAAGDVHALLVSIRDNDQAAFEAHVDRPALTREVESRLMAEASKQNAGPLGALFAQPLAQIASDTLIQPQVFRTVAQQYGYDPAKPLPGPMAISGALKTLDDGRVCATRKKDGPCLLIFTESGGTWKLSGFEGELSELRR